VDPAAVRFASGSAPGMPVLAVGSVRSRRGGEGTITGDAGERRVGPVELQREGPRTGQRRGNTWNARCRVIPLQALVQCRTLHAELGFGAALSPAGAENKRSGCFRAFILG
jgi:hypothetical protein